LIRQLSAPLSSGPQFPTAARYTAAGCFLAVAGLEIARMKPSAAIWAAPAILLAAMLIAWAAESAQFFISQGFALAILAWLQTMPEFAVEAVLAWKQQTPLILANLTGALRLLTGLGWPMIYATAAFFHRRRYRRPLKSLKLAHEHSVEVMGLLLPLVYIFLVWWKATLTVWDGLILTLIYAAYLFILSKIPPQTGEGIEGLDRIPRAIARSNPPLRIFLIALLFAAGGGLIYFTAEPFLGSLLAVSAILGVPSFVFVQWVAPFVSEFPEKVSAFYWARTIDGAPMALMNMVSSNINQWTLLPAMLALIYSISVGHPAPIRFDSHQELELLMTLGQALVGMIFLMNMELSWWEAATLFLLWLFQFVFSPMQPGPGLLAQIAGHAHVLVTQAYFLWFGIGVLRIAAARHWPKAFALFAAEWKLRVMTQH
jgi:cation:H+ antiporter